IEEKLQNKSNELVEYGNNITKLHKVITKNHKNYEGLFGEYLQAGLEIFNLHTGIISNIVKDKYYIRSVVSNLDFLKSGMEFELCDTYCELVVKEDMTIAFNSAKAIAESKIHPITPNEYFESYISAPIYVNGKIYGTINFTSKEKREKEFQLAEYKMIELMSESIGSFITRERIESVKNDIEKALKESEARHRSIIDTAADAVITISSDGTIRSVNKVFTKLFQYSDNDVIDKNVRILVPEPYKEHHDEYLKSYLQTGDAKVIGIGREVPARRKDGTIFPADLAVSEFKIGDAVMFTGIIRDISERKIAEDALRKSEESLAKAQKIADLGNWEWDVETGELFWSEQTYRIFGFDPEKDKTSFDLYKKCIFPEDRERLMNAIDLAVKKGVDHTIEHRILIQNNEIRFIRGKGEVTKNEKGKVVKLIGTFQDITDIKTAENQIKKISERLELATDVAFIGIWDWDVPNNFLYWDDTMYDLYGLKKEDYPNAYDAWLKCLHPEDSKRIQEEVDLALKGEKEFNAEYRIMWTDGSVHYLKASTTVAKDKKGRALRMIGVNRDITDRKNAENERSILINKLEETSNELNAILDSVGDAIVTLNIDHEIVTANSAFLEMFNKNEEEILGRTCGNILKEIDPESAYDNGVDDTVLNKRNTEDRLSSRTEMRTPDGQKVVVEAITSALKDADNNIIGAVKSIRNVTKEAEIDRMKSEFISMVSHELRTPLTSIKGYIDLILAGDTGEINDLQKEFLEIVYENSERLNNLINDLLDVEKIESGHVEMIFKKINLSNLALNAVKTMQGAAEKKGLELKYNIEEDIEYKGDKDRLVQCFVNFISNAIKYTKEGRIDVTFNIENNNAVFSVKDTGIGINAADKKRLFSKFFRSDHEYARDAGGTGLGLSIVKSIVDKHGGKIEVESKLNKGSVFRIVLPIV
ncbi:PAS domain S-box protein, partial [candidate division KSB1 bacterium]